MDAPFEGCADIDKDVAMKTTAAKMPKCERNIVLLNNSGHRDQKRSRPTVKFWRLNSRCSSASVGYQQPDAREIFCSEKEQISAKVTTFKIVSCGLSQFFSGYTP